MKLALTFALIFIISIANADTGLKNVGFKTAKITAKNHRDLAVAIWYPTQSQSTPSTVLENGIFYGETVVENAKLDSKKHPLVVISHGFMGYFGNQAWLAQVLASRGFIVASPNHPGTSNKDHNRTAKKELWRRPKDLSVVIDHMLSTHELAGKVDDKNIYAIGHSLGAWSVVGLAGGHFSHEKMLKFCDTQKIVIDCDIYRGITADGFFSSNEDNLRKLSSDLSDKRVKGIIALDMGDFLQKGFTPASLKNITTPTLFIDADSDSTPLSNNMPNAKRIKLHGALHFSLLQRCKPRGFDILEEESKGDGILCLDDTGANRKILHTTTIEKILTFLSQQGAPINH